jgi:hypothetical protein
MYGHVQFIPFGSGCQLLAHTSPVLPRPVQLKRPALVAQTRAGLSPKTARIELEVLVTDYNNAQSTCKCSS